MRTSFRPIHAAAAAAALAQVLLLAVAPVPVAAQQGIDTTGRSVPPDHSVVPDSPTRRSPPVSAQFCLPLDLAYPGVPASHGGGACTPRPLPPVVCDPPLVKVGNSCVSNPITTCNPPNIIVDGGCVPPVQCFPPARAVKNVCVCPPPTEPDGANGCHCPDPNATISGSDCPCNDTAMVVVDGLCRCPPPMTLESGACVCPEGETRVDDACVPDVCEGELRLIDGVCKCPAGTTPYGTNQCCPAGHQVSGGQCRRICGGDLILIGDACGCPEKHTPYGVDRCCPPTREVVLNQCLVPCGGDLVRQADATCGCPAATPPMTLFPPDRCCPAGEQLIDGACQLPPPCLPPQQLIGGICQCPPATPVLSEGHCCPVGEQWNSVRGACERLDTLGSVCSCPGGVGFNWPGGPPYVLGLGPGDALCGPHGTFENQLCPSGLGVDYVIADGPNAGNYVSICEGNESMLASATCTEECPGSAFGAALYWRTGVVSWNLQAGFGHGPPPQPAHDWCGATYPDIPVGESVPLTPTTNNCHGTASECPPPTGSVSLGCQSSGIPGVDPALIPQGMFCSVGSGCPPGWSSHDVISYECVPP